MKCSLIYCALLAGLVAGTTQAQVQTGNGAVATKSDTTAVGDRAQSLTVGATAIGADALADGGIMVDENGVPGECLGATAVGNRTTARGCHTTALRFSSEAQGSNALAIGSRAQAFAVYAVAVGPQAQATGDKDGGSSTAVAGANIEVTDNGNGTQTVALKDTVELSEQGSVQVAKAIHNSDGFTVQGGPTVTRSRINAGNQRVTGVAAGAIAPGSTDAINGGQLWDYQRQQDDRWNLTDRRFRQLDKRVSGVCAMAQANAQMATSTSAIHGENRNRLAVGVGGCSGQAAISIGYTRDVTTPRGSPSAFSIGVSRSGQDTAVGAAWAIGW